MRFRDRQCATCIYRPDNPLDLDRLEAEVADPMMRGHFALARICHADNVSVCKGFEDRHGAECTPIQIVRRLEAMGVKNDAA